MTSSNIEACKWLALALNNLKRALKLRVETDFPSSVFHFQQTLEFYIKAIIVFLGAEPKRSHDPGQQLKSLLEETQIDDQLQSLFQLSSELSQDYLASRYPTDDLPWDVYAMDDVLDIEKKIVMIIKQLKRLIVQLMPENKFNLRDCLLQAVKNSKMQQIVEEMVPYID